jgi:hypothetical protein
MLLELPVDPGRLFYTDDPHYCAWLGNLIERVMAKRKAEDEKAKRKGKRRGRR